jgi:chromosome partitioning protein
LQVLLSFLSKKWTYIMPIIAFANPKGGAGKTTSALLLASELAAGRASITIIDADPEKWLSQWGALPGKPDNLTIVSAVTEDTIVDQIEEAARRSQFVIVDLEGTASLMVANAIGMADLVLIPTQGASMDARGAAKTIRLIRNQARLARREIAHRVLLTRTSAAVTSRALRNVRDQLDQSGIPVLNVAIVERAAYRDILDYGGLLSQLDPKLVSNLGKAIDNARAYVSEVLELLRATRSHVGKAA